MMRMDIRVLAWLFALVMACGVVVADEEGKEDPLAPARDAMEKGEEFLQRTLSSEKKAGDAVRAANEFAQAAKVFREGRDNEGADTADACLFWSTKLIEEADLAVYEEVRNDTLVEAMARIEAVEVNPGDAGNVLSQIQGFAIRNPHVPWRIAARYFEMKSRYEGTPAATQAKEAFETRLMDARIATASDAQAEEFLREYVEGYTGEATKMEEAIRDAVTRYLETLGRLLEQATRAGDTDGIAAIEKEMADIRRTQSISMEDFSAMERSATVTRIAAAQRVYNQSVQRALQGFIRSMEREVRTLQRNNQGALANLLQDRMQGPQNILTTLQNLAGRARVARDLVGRWQMRMEGVRSARYTFVWEFEQDGTFTSIETYHGWGTHTSTRRYRGQWTFDGRKVVVTRSRTQYSGEVETPIRRGQLRGVWRGSLYTYYGGDHADQAEYKFTAERVRE